MKEIPFTLRKEMVQAILEGRKSQIRSFMRRQPDAVERYKRGVETTETNAQYAVLRCYNPPNKFKPCNSGWLAHCTYTPFSEFQVGDHLWVREAWRIGNACEAWSMDNSQPCQGWIDYKAGGSKQVTAPTFDDLEALLPKDWDWDFIPSTHFQSKKMPRWACRLVLEIVNIRVERIQDISEADATAEGMIADDEYCAEQYFSMFWNQVNGWKEKGWNANPWVWVIEFKVIEGA